MAQKPSLLPNLICFYHANLYLVLLVTVIKKSRKEKLGGEKLWHNSKPNLFISLHKSLVLIWLFCSASWEKIWGNLSKLSNTLMNVHISVCLRRMFLFYWSSIVSKAVSRLLICDVMRIPHNFLRNCSIIFLFFPKI